MDAKTAMDICIEKTKLHIAEFKKSGFKEYCTCTNGNFFTEGESAELNSKWVWTASFFTGMASIAYEHNGDKEILSWLESLYDLYYDKIFNHGRETMHDLGFVYSPYGVMMYKLTGEAKYREISIKAADELCKRYVFDGGYINAWADMDDESIAEMPYGIIDCMMNLPLLFWAWKETGNRFYYHIAKNHADMTLKYMVRDDFSVYHAYAFYPETGQPEGGRNYCGFEKESHWARGTAWGVYGFIVAYQYTQDERYAEAAVNVANKYIESLDGESVPPWDFRLNEDMPKDRDTSAAVIMACALFEIVKEGKATAAIEKLYRSTLDEVLGDRYFNTDEDVHGILRESNGRYTYTIFGDYFFMELFAKEMGIITDLCW